MFKRDPEQKAKDKAIRDKDQDPYEHLTDKSKAARQGDTEVPGSDILGESFEQKVNRAPETTDDDK